jgi:hypothetical protein
VPSYPDVISASCIASRSNGSAKPGNAAIRLAQATMLGHGARTRSALAKASGLGRKAAPVKKAPVKRKAEA